MSITATEARTRLFPLIDEVNDDMAAVEVVGRRGSVFIVPAEEYRALQETMYLLSSPVNAERLRASVAGVRGGRARPRRLVEPDDDVSADATTPLDEAKQPRQAKSRSAKVVAARQPGTRSAPRSRAR